MLLTRLFVYATYNTRHNLTLAMARNLFFIKFSHGVHTSMFSTSAYKNRKNVSSRCFQTTLQEAEERQNDIKKKKKNT